MSDVNEILKFLDEKESELNELIKVAADVLGFELHIPGKLPSELEPALLFYVKRATVLRSRIEKLEAQTMSLIQYLKSSCIAGLEWRINPVMLQSVNDLLTQLKAAINYLDATNREIVRLVDKIYNYKIQLNYNSPALFYERR
jgi:hypothetical protein